MSTADAMPDRWTDRQPIGRLVTLFAVIYFAQSIGEPTAGLVSQPVRSLLRTWGEGPAFIGAFTAAVSLPWVLKPLWGIITDFIPFLGYRRRSYLVLCGLLGAAGYFGLYWFRPQSGNYVLFISLLSCATVTIAFADVVVDGLMVDKGKPLGLTGVLQSVQWTASYAATLVLGIGGGYLSQHGMEYEAFLIAGMFSLLTAWLAWAHVQEPHKAGMDTAHLTVAAFKQAASSPVLVSVALFLFLWSLDPLTTTIVYLHMTETMGLDDQFFGYALSTLAVGSMLGAASYSLYCRRVPLLRLAHMSIVLGATSQALFWLMGGPQSALMVHFAVGFAWMTALMIQLDLAARACPPLAAATVFAVVMAMTNLAGSLGEFLGGSWYQSLSGLLGPQVGFNWMVLFGVCAKASCWMLFLLLPGPLSMRRTIPMAAQQPGHRLG